MSKPSDKYNVFKPEFELHSSILKDFLLNFKDKTMENDIIHGKNKYMSLIQKISNHQSKVLEIHLDDLESFVEKDYVVYECLMKNTKRYIKILYDVVDTIMPKRSVELKDEDIDPRDEVLITQRMYNLSNEKKTDKPVNKRNQIPLEMIRKHEIIISPGQNQKTKYTLMRGLKSNVIGSFVSVKAIVVRITAIKPFIRVASYSCDVCGNEIYQTIPDRIFLPLLDCPSTSCKNNQTRGKLNLVVRGSKFMNYQEIMVQEPTEQVPTGHVPRSSIVLAFGESVGQCAPGDIVTIHGIYLPSSLGKNKTMMKLLQDSHIECFKIIKEKLSYKDTSISEHFLEKIEKQKIKTPDLYSALTKSIAPEIYGMEEIKKALLLLLVGGVSKTMKDGMKIRGNINVLLMGDPGVAKSQLLKFIAHIAPRGIYTTGKGSSGVGLTAAVVRDKITNDLVLEGGALVLADMGICCIDEFDKMSDYDRANIHEVMEQQTVSISKAGITTRLNARASVLAAANPIYGRYNKKLTPQHNINLPAALLSRFDLIFLILDKVDTKVDELLAKHVTFVHQFNVHPKDNEDNLSPEFIRSYIAEARNIEPVIPKELHNFIIEKYVNVRKNDFKNTNSVQYITPRTLLGIIRIAQGLARLRFNNEVEQIDIDNAINLVDSSRNSLQDEDEDREKKNMKNDVMSSVFQYIRLVCSKRQDKTVKYTDLERKLIQMGFTKESLNDCVNEYSKLNVLYISEDGTQISLL